MKNNTLPKHIKIIHDACTKAMRVVNRDFIELSYLQSSNQSSMRKFASICDAKAERAALDALRKATPSYGIICEESDEANSNSLDALLGRAITQLPDSTMKKKFGYIWVVDPIDGTSNFVHANKNFVVSIALLEINMHNQADKKIVSAGIYAPMTQEFFWAEKEQGAYLMDQNGQQTVLRVSSTTGAEITGVMAATVLPRTQCNEYNKLFSNLQSNKAKIRISGSIALDLAHMAAGRYDAVFLAYPKIWDWAAGALIVQEAGGIVAAAGFNNTDVAVTGVASVNDKVENTKTPLSMQVKNISLNIVNPLFMAANINLVDTFRKFI